MGKRKMKSKGIPATIKLVQSMLKSIYKDADKNMFVCESLKGTTLLLPCSLTSRQIFDEIWRLNNAEGNRIPTPSLISRAPVQTKLFD